MLPITKDSAEESQAPTASAPLTVSPKETSVKEGPLKEFVENSTGSQMTYVSLKGDFRTGTSTERFARPALSLSKLYIAQYVMEHGTDIEKRLASEMIRNSSDVAAEILYGTYPESIDKIADEFGLLSTRGDEHWGYSVTSTYDVAKFVATLLKEQPTSPVLEAMHQANSVSADGYPQDWGTAVLDGAEGTKWGWSDDLQLHSSVTFGKDYVVAAAVTGTKEDLTQLVENQMEKVLEQKKLARK